MGRKANLISALLTLLFAVTVTPSSAKNATYSLCKTKLPAPLAFLGGIYDGDDGIYLFGGGNYSGPVNQILLNKISSDEIQIAGSLPQPGQLFHSNSISLQSTGIINVFLTEEGKIVQFDKKANRTNLVSNFTIYAEGSQFQQLGEDEVVFIGGAFSVFPCRMLKINLTTMETRFFGEECGRKYAFRSSVAFNKKEGLLYFIGEDIETEKRFIMQYSMEERTITELLEIGDRSFSSAAVWANDQVYFIDTVGDGDGEFVTVYKPSENRVSYLPVDGMSRHQAGCCRPAVYVERLQRIYLFGGISSEGVQDAIWKIDLNVDNATTPTPAVTTSTTPTATTKTTASTTTTTTSTFRRL